MSLQIQSTMPEGTITCPKCGHTFEMSDAHCAELAICHQERLRLRPGLESLLIRQCDRAAEGIAKPVTGKAGRYAAGRRASGSACAPRAVPRALARHTGRELAFGEPWVSGCFPRGAENGRRGARAPRGTPSCSRASNEVWPFPSLPRYFIAGLISAPRNVCATISAKTEGN